jgi:hypothetical protein
MMMGDIVCGLAIGCVGLSALLPMTIDIELESHSKFWFRLGIVIFMFWAYCYLPHQ